MPIDRTLFNLWVDDDGSNTVGTLINKSRIDSDILDPIDDALAAGTVAGSNTQVQFNDGGALGADAGLVYNKTTDALTTGSLVATLGQIVFPATQNASANANTLDDYEEGTWAATFTMGTSGTVTVDTGFDTGLYTKIGRQVTVTGYFTFSSVSSPLGTLIIGGLPFTLSNPTERAGWAVPALYFNGMGSGVAQVIGQFSSGTSMPISKFAAGAAAGFASGDLVGGFVIQLSMTYFTS